MSAPTVTALSPASGPAGTLVTITGTGFTDDASAVMFGAVSAGTRFSVVSDTSITAYAPAGTGTVAVKVTTPGGVTAVGSNWTYDPYIGPPAGGGGVAPTVTSVVPDSAVDNDGGDEVVVNGSGFTTATAVLFGDALAQFAVISDTALAVTTPGGSGVVDVTVVSAYGISANTAADNFTYPVGLIPTITSFTPAATGEMALVTITGTNFWTAAGIVVVTGVTFTGAGGIEIPAPFRAESATSLVASVPDGALTGPIKVYSEAGSATSASFTCWGGIYGGIDPSRLPAFETYFVGADTPGAPSAVANLAGDAAFTMIILSWDLPPEALWRTWEVYEGGAAGFTPVTPILTTDQTVVSIPHVTGSGPWYYKVRALNSRGEASAYSEVGPFTLPTIETVDLGPGSVHAEAMAAGAVDLASAVVSGQLLAAKLADNAVTQAKLADNAVTQAKIVANAVTSAKIAGGSVLATKLAANAVALASPVVTPQTAGGDVDLPWHSCAVNADGSVMLASAQESLYRSIDGALSWTKAPPAVGGTFGCAVNADGSVMLAGRWSGRLHFTKNGGTVWSEERPAGDVDLYWRDTAVSADGSVMLAGFWDYNGSTGVSGLYLTVSRNQYGYPVWTDVILAGAVNEYWHNVAVSGDGNVLLAVAQNGRLYCSRDRGTTWAEHRPAGDMDRNWYGCALDADGSVMLASDCQRLYLTTNGGTTWAETGPTPGVDANWHDLSVSDNGVTFFASSRTRLWFGQIGVGGEENWRETRPAGDVDGAWLLAGAAGNGSVLLAGNANESGPGSGRLYVSDTAGYTWAETRAAAMIGPGAISTTELAGAVTASITTAQATADGKNTVIFSTSLPSGTAFVNGDVWFQKQPANALIIGQWEFVSGAWAPRQFNNTVIANLDAGKITSGSIAAARIAAGTITSTMISADTIVAGNIAANAIGTLELAALAVTAAKIAAGTITANEIAAATITGAQIAADTIVAGNIAAGAITASELAALSVIAGKIDAGAVTATEIAAGAVIAGKIAARSIAADRIVAGAITATEINAGAITTAKLAAGAVTTNELAALSVTAAKIVAGTITADRIATGAITAAEIAAGTITAAKLNVADVQAGIVTAAAINAVNITAANITGGTITGTTIRTAASGQRVQMVNSEIDRISFYDGQAHTPGYVNTAWDGTNASLAAFSPQVTAGKYGYLSLNAAAGVGQAVLGASGGTFVTVDTEVLVGGNLRVYGSLKSSANWVSAGSADGIWIQDRYSSGLSNRWKLCFNSNTKGLSVSDGTNTYNVTLA